MNLSDSRTAGQADGGHSPLSRPAGKQSGQPAAGQNAAAGERTATSGAVHPPAAPDAATPAAPAQPTAPTLAATPPAAIQNKTPLARLSAAEAVFTAIRQDIESGVVELGAKLSSEATLASQYGVSRSVIREALRSCNALGLTVTKTGKGTFVVANKVANDLTLGQYSARDLNEARPHIEIPAAGLAARRRSPEDLTQLRGLMQEMLAENEAEAWVDLDAAFHSTIARASGNKVFETVVSDIRGALAHQSETLNIVADRRHASDDEHLRIIEAIDAGDAKAAETAMAEHLAAVSVALDSILNSGI